MKNPALFQRLWAVAFLAICFFILNSVVDANESEVDERFPSWLCSKVKEVAAENPLNNVIGFKEGHYKLIGPLNVKRISLPEGCHETTKVHQASGQI